MKRGAGIEPVETSQVNTTIFPLRNPRDVSTGRFSTGWQQTQEANRGGFFLAKSILKQEMAQSLYRFVTSGHLGRRIL